MTFNPVAALNVIECKELISKESPNAIDLGSQTPSINNNFIKNLISTNKHLTKIQKVNLNELSNNMKFSTKDFITKIGFNNYNSIDLNGAYESFKFDLNKDICTAYDFNSKGCKNFMAGSSGISYPVAPDNQTIIAIINSFIS